MKKSSSEAKIDTKTMNTKRGEIYLRKTETNQAESKFWQTILPVALFVLVVGFYLPSVPNDFVYDDLTLIKDQAMPRSLFDAFKVFGERHWYNLPYYRPVCRLTMVVQKFLHGNDPKLYHLFNASLMGIAALLLYALLRLPAFNIPMVPALVGAGLFAVHPISSCTVYPICSGRETLIPAIFVMASMYAFLRSNRAGYALAMVMFVFSLLSKEQAVVVPGLFVLADMLGITAGAQKRSVYRWAARYTPVFLILLVYFWIRWLVFDGTETYRFALFNNPSGPLLSILYTLQTMLVPFVELVYEPKLEVWISAWRQFLVLAVVIYVVVAFCRCWPAVRHKVLFWFGWFLFTLLPTSNLLVQEARFAERYGFLASIGLIGIAGVLISTFWDRPPTRRNITVAGIVLLFVFGAIAFNRNTYFKNHEVFMVQWLSTNPESFQAHVSVGEIFQRDGKIDEAIHHYREAIQHNPNYEDAHNNLGLAYYNKGMLDDSISEYKKALAINPDLTKAHYNLGLAYCNKDELDDAIAEYRKALALNPNLSDAHNNLGVTYYYKGNYKLAIIHLDKAAELGCRVDKRLLEVLKAYR